MLGHGSEGASRGEVGMKAAQKNRGDWALLLLGVTRRYWAKLGEAV